MLKGEAEALGVAERVRFIGAVDSMTDVLACLDVFALPSIWEGLPMAILEAMSGGVPIVATDVGGVGGALEDGKTALLVPPADPAAFADGLARMLASAETRERLAKNAREEFDRNFSSGAMARSYTELYERALDGG
jgi:glycosyltransferase involved in cell wall biosynthesis